MDRALALASRGRGRTSPNPMVGAVVVSADGVVVGEGFHARAGGDHAETRALAAAGSSAGGATLYCTLEPCCHHGRTSPCAPRIVAAGVTRVVAAMVDPDPRVRGGGLAYLRGRDVRVDVGVRQAAAEQLNEAFVVWVARGRPFVTMKIATSLDGRIAARPGTRTALTAEPAARAVHEQRAVVDAVGIGSTTLLVDDPLLTARGVVRHAPLTRVVFDRRLRTPPSARIFGTLSTGPVVIVTTERAAAARPDDVSRLAAAGADVEAVAAGDVGEGLRAAGRAADYDVGCRRRDDDPPCRVGGRRRRSRAALYCAVQHRGGRRRLARRAWTVAGRSDVAACSLAGAGRSAGG